MLQKKIWGAFLLTGVGGGTIVKLTENAVLCRWRVRERISDLCLGRLIILIATSDMKMFLLGRGGWGNKESKAAILSLLSLGDRLFLLPVLGAAAKRLGDSDTVFVHKYGLLYFF